MPAFQTPSTRPEIDRTDHIWAPFGRLWRCCTCGALAANPPPYPTPADYVAPRYELPLTEVDRELARSTIPFQMSKKG